MLRCGMASKPKCSPLTTSGSSGKHYLWRHMSLLL